MADRRLIPIDGENPYANHPGLDAQGCHLQYTVTPAYYSSSMHGFGCEVTGGHCLPCEQCQLRRDRYPVSVNEVTP